MRNLSIIDETLKMVKACRDKELRLDEIPEDDPKTFALLSRGDTTGVFQLSNNSVGDYLIKLRPNCLADIIAITALYRPGPIESGMLDVYIGRRNGKQGFTFEVEAARPILEPTYGMVLYAEQIMRIAHELAGYTMAEADVFRLELMKDKDSALKAQQDRFICGAESKGINPGEAKMLFDQLKREGGYAFPKAHAVAYSLITYQAAYLKANYRLEFMGALLNCNTDYRSRLQELVEECVGEGIRFLSPEDTSQKEFTTQGGKIRLGSRVLSKLPKATVRKLSGLWDN